MALILETEGVPSPALVGMLRQQVLEGRARFPATQPGAGSAASGAESAAVDPLSLPDRWRAAFLDDRVSTAQLRLAAAAGADRDPQAFHWSATFLESRDEIRRVLRDSSVPRRLRDALRAWVLGDEDARKALPRIVSQGSARETLGYIRRAHPMFWRVHAEHLRARTARQAASSPMSLQRSPQTRAAPMSRPRTTRSSVSSHSGGGATAIIFLVMALVGVLRALNRTTTPTPDPMAAINERSAEFREMSERLRRGIREDPLDPDELVRPPTRRRESGHSRYLRFVRQGGNVPAEIKRLFAELEIRTQGTRLHPRVRELRTVHTHRLKEDRETLIQLWALEKEARELLRR